MRKVHVQRALGGVGQVGQIGIKAVGKTRSGGVLEKAHDRGRIRRQNLGKGLAIGFRGRTHGESAIIILVNAQGRKVDQSAIATNGVGRIVQKARLQRAYGQVAFERRRGNRAGGIDYILRINGADDCVVG